MGKGLRVGLAPSMRTKQERNVQMRRENEILGSATVAVGRVLRVLLHGVGALCIAGS